MEVEPANREQSCDPSHPPMRLLAFAYVMSAMGGRLRRAGTWPGEPSSLADTRLEHLIPASSGTLSDLPAHGKATWRPTEGRALRAWVASKGSSNGWPGQLLPYSEISPGGVLSLVPPNTTVPKAGRLGFVLHIGWYTVLLHCPPFSHPSHLSLLRDMESSGAGLPHVLHSPRRDRQRSSSLLEPSQSLPLWGCDTIGATCRRGCGVYPPVFCASTPGLMGGIPEGLHSPEDPTGYFVLCPQTLKT